MRHALDKLLRGSTHEATARLSALVLSGILVLAVVGYAALHFGWFAQGPEYQAEFKNAWPLVPGMDVRVSGAVVGSVRGVELTNHGSALVTFQLRPGVPAPRADASVAIRQDDLLGDSDLSLQLGTAKQPLTGPIPSARSIPQPRLDDFLNIFRAPVRAGLQAFIVEVGTAMANRGVDVNSAIFRLRPGFQALGNVFTELSGQIGSLKQVLASAHHVTSQLGGRSHDLGRLVDGLHQTLHGVAAQSARLNRGLALLPATLSETSTTLGQLTTLTSAVRPLAQTVAAAAPGFQTAAQRLGPYAQALQAASGYAAPTITLAGNALRAAGPTLAPLSRAAVSDLLNPASGLFAALKPIFDDAANALFGSPNGVGGLGGVVVPGNDATALNVDPARDYLAGYLVIGCQLFGVPASPGCLSHILSTYFPKLPSRRPATPRAHGTAGAPPAAPSPGSTSTTTATIAPTKPPLPTINLPPLSSASSALAGAVKSLLGFLIKR
jgi:phospholipid/cholesterol/gamma-HCH transport system substrate-binding protein